MREVERLYTVPEFATAIQSTVSVVNKMIEKGLPFLKFNRYRRIRLSSYEQWLAENTRTVSYDKAPEPVTTGVGSKVRKVKI